MSITAMLVEGVGGEENQAMEQRLPLLPEKPPMQKLQTAQLFIQDFSIHHVAIPHSSTIVAPPIALTLSVILAYYSNPAIHLISIVPEALDDQGAGATPVAAPRKPLARCGLVV